MPTSFYSDYVTWAKGEKMATDQSTPKIKQYLILHIRNSQEDPIQTDKFKITSLEMSTKKLKIRTPATPFGTKQHIMLHKLAEKGCHHAFLVNNINDIKNPITAEIPIIYMMNGNVTNHYTWNNEGNAGLTTSEHYFEIEFKKISAYFVRGGKIDFDGDKFGPRDPNLIKMGLTIESIGYENLQENYERKKTHA